MPASTTPFECPPSSSGSSRVRDGGVRRRQAACPQARVRTGRSMRQPGSRSSGRTPRAPGWSATASTRTWAGAVASTGRVAVRRPTTGEVGYSSPPLFSSYFGWQIICGWSTCNGTTKPGEISVLGLELEAAEGSGPSVFVTPGSLGAASGWVRGTWPIAFSADGPTGACQLSASLGWRERVAAAQRAAESGRRGTSARRARSRQSFNTAAVASGAGVPLVMWARDAAYDYSAGHYLSGTATSYVNIDNDPVSVSVVGPTDAPSTAGTQYVTATGSAGPSGVVGHRLFARRRSVSVVSERERAGAGERDRSPHGSLATAPTTPETPAGHVATSTPQTWTLSIREPTVSGIGFGKLVDALLCHRVTRAREGAGALGHRAPTSQARSGQDGGPARRWSG